MVNETATNSHAQSKMIRCKYELRRCIKWETNKKTPATHHKWLLWRYGACTLFPPGIACYLKELGTLGLSRHAQTVKRKSSYLPALTCSPPHLYNIQNFQHGCISLESTAKHCAPHELLKCFHRVPAVPESGSPRRVPTCCILRAEQQAHQSLAHLHMALLGFLPCRSLA